MVNVVKIIVFKVRQMASKELAKVCRFCSIAIPLKNSASLFLSEALGKSLPERLSALLQLPLSPDDGYLTIVEYVCGSSLWQSHSLS